MVKQCEYCKKEFDGAGKSAYCSDLCRKDAHRARCREYWHKNKDVILAKKRASRKQEPTTETNNMSLAEVNRLAREEGLSYGKYVAKYGLS